MCHIMMKNLVYVVKEHIYLEDCNKLKKEKHKDQLFSLKEEGVCFGLAKTVRLVSLGWLVKRHLRSGYHNSSNSNRIPVAKIGGTI